MLFFRCCMSFFAIGKNEIESLQSQERDINRRLSKQTPSQDGSGGAGNVFSFQDVVLKKQQEKLRNKIAVLKYLNPNSNNDDDSLA